MQIFCLFDWPILRKYIMLTRKIETIKCWRNKRRRNLEFNLSTLWAQQLPTIGIMQRSTNFFLNNLITRRTILCSASLMKYALIIMKGLRKLRARNLKESGKREMKASLKTSERLPKLLVCCFLFQGLLQFLIYSHYSKVFYALTVWLSMCCSKNAKNTLRTL